MYVWIRIQGASAARGRATNLALNSSNLATRPPQNLANRLPKT
jgi:hypothetical protein